MAKDLKDPEVKPFCHFLVYALKLLNTYSAAFQTMPVVLVLYRMMYVGSCILLSNFIDPDDIKSIEDITSIAFTEQNVQLSNDELGIGTSTHLLWCRDLEELVGTAVAKLINSVQMFYETCVAKID